MNHLERSMAALGDAEADRLPVYPIACGVNRKLLGENVTYAQWCKDPKTFADAFIAGQKHFDFDFAIGLMDLSVMAGDLGAHVRMDDEITPFVDKPIINSLEDYEKLEVPDITKGRSHVLVEGTRLFTEKLKDQVVCASFLEGPLLALTQCAGAERVFMDMFTNPSAVHAGLKTMVDYDVQMVEALVETGAPGLVWDYLWANYSCLGDKEYHEFEGNSNYAGKLNKLVVDSGVANCVHNCADLPHLDTQVKEYKPAMFSMAYYPLIPDSPRASEVIEKGYADNCLIAGNIDPQLFIRGSAEKISKVTSDLCQEVKTALCKRGLNSRYCISSGCEVPPDRATKLENLKAVVDVTKRDGVLEEC